MPNLVDITIKADDETAAGFASVLARYYALKNAMQNITVDVDASSITPALISIKQKVQSIGLADIADVNVQPGILYQRLYYIKRAMQQVGLTDILGIGLAGAAGGSGAAALSGALGGSGGNGGGGAGLGAAAGAAAGGGGGGGGGFGWAAAFGAAAASVSLFGGALGNLPLIGVTHGFVLMGDAILQTATIIGGAAIAFAAWAGAAVPTVQAIYQQMKTLYTVSQALNIQIPGLSGGFSKMAASVQPSVYSIFGDALTIINQKGGIFQTLVAGTSVVMDQLASRLTLAITNGGGFSKFLQDANHDLFSLGTIIGNVGGIIGNLFKAMPGYGQILLNIATAATGAAESFTGMIEPVLRLGLQFHGAFLYGGLLATGLTRLVAGGTFFGAAFAGILPLISKFSLNAAVAADSSKVLGAAGDVASKGLLGVAGAAESASLLPWGWIATAAVGLGILAYWAFNSKTAMQELFIQLQNNINDATTWNGVLQATAAAIASTTKQLNQLNASASNPAIAANVTSAAAFTANMQSAKSSLQNFNTEQVTERQRMMELTIMFGSQGAAINAVNALHMKLGTTLTEQAKQWAIDQNSLIGYNNALIQMAGYAGGQALAAQNALNLAQNSQLQAIQQVAKAESAYISLLTGGESAFSSFGQGLVTVSTNAQAAGASMYGLNSQSLTLTSSFEAAVNQGEAWVNWAQQANPTNAQLSQGVADIAANLLAVGGNSTATTQQVVGFINNALGPATVNSQNLNSWLATMGGKNGTMAALNGITTVLTGNISALSQQINGLVNQSFSAAMFKASGLSGDLQTLANDLVHNQTSAQGLQPIYNSLVQDFINSGLNADQARTKVGSLITQYGKVPASVVTKLQADNSNALAAIAATNNGLNGLNGKTINTYINTHYASYYATYGLPPGSSPGTGGTGHAYGGITTAASGGAKGGLVRVGEMGAEMVQLPSGSHVIPSGNQSAQMAAMGGQGVHVLVTADRVALTQIGLSQQQIDAIRYEVRTKGGGNVQKAFGYGQG